jgi:hypothetical protein
MAISNVEIEDRYKPKTDTEDIVVTVTIGNGGVGGFLVFLDKKLKAANRPSRIGKRAAVLDKWTIVSATVPDVLEETNWTSITVFIEEGKHKTRYGPYSKEVSTHLDTVCFLIKIKNTDEN